MNGSTWDPDANCDIQQCKKGCCIIGNEAFFVTPVRCKAETSLFPNVTMTFDESIVTEQGCIAKSRAEDEGCCVSGTECKFSKRGSCQTASTVQTGNQTGDGFYPGMLCSNDKLKCDCAKQQNTGCVAGLEEVYWFDSCGNKENIFSSDKVLSYNNGYVLPASQTCKLKSANDPNCGNCDYSTGTLCGASPSNVNMNFGDYTCRDVSCKSTYKDSVSSNAGTPKKNGESWCIYDTLPGLARDAVGSRHFRHICVNGEEFIEPCRDYREEICIQGVMGNEPASTSFESFGVKGNYVEAACRDNRWEDCFACNSQTACGGDCADKGVECCIKKCCEEISVRDCFWMKAGIAAGVSGVCVADVPPGFAFWAASVLPVSSSTRSATSAPLASTPTPSTTTSAVVDVTSAAVSTASGTSTITGTGGAGSGSCSQANQECTVSWHRGGISRVFSIENWKCTKNCHCTEHNWVVAGNNLCKAMGDCGAYFNILGKVTTDGYANTASAESKWFQGSKLTIAEVGDWSALSKPGKAAKEESSGMFGGDKFSEFFKKAGLPLAVMAAQGIYTGYATAWTKGAFTGGMTAGLSTMGNAVGYLFTLGKGPGITSGWATTYGTKEVFKTGEFIKSGRTFSQGDTLNVLKTNSGVIEGTPSFKAYKSALEGTNAVGTPEGFLKTIQPSQQELFSKELIKSGVDGKFINPAEGGFEIAKDGMFKVPEGTNSITSVPTSGTIMGALNTIMWLYTIYQIVDVFLAEDESETYKMSCNLWVAPDGGADCEKCNEDNNNKPCSEYRCKSLGKLCSLINQGSKEEKCVNIHPNDANSPVISPWKEALPKGFTLTEITAESNKGFKINQKLKPFQSITLGIKTDEPSQCKFGSENSVDYDQKTAFFGDGIFKYEHEITFSLPSDLTTPEALKLTNGGLYNIYIRCKDATGNKNNRDYFVRFSIEPSPDLTAPVIERTSVESGAFAPNGVNQTTFSVYTNEPADCRWNLNDTEFGLMDKKFVCADSGFSLSSIYYGLYECKTTLDINAEGVTDYYIRCKDKKGNVNTESYQFNLRSSNALNIDSAGPSGTFYTSNVELKVITSGGAQNGEARCGYANADIPFLSMIEFYETNSTVHTQPFVLDKGDYRYFIMCRDVAGNDASTNVSFKVDVDLESSKIVYIYSEGSILHMELNEISNCQYSTNSTFAYGAGVQMTGTDSVVHELTIASPVYYINCIDVFKNEAKFTVYV